MRPSKSLFVFLLLLALVLGVGIWSSSRSPAPTFDASRCYYCGGRRTVHIAPFAGYKPCPVCQGTGRADSTAQAKED